MTTHVTTFMPWAEHEVLTNTTATPKGEKTEVVPIVSTLRIYCNTSKYQVSCYAMPTPTLKKIDILP